jgi:nucleoside-diphosphate-sugar epimerase
MAFALQKASASIIIHCAAYGLNYAQQDAWQALAVNVEGSLRLMEAAQSHGIRRFVHVGTCFEYGSYDVPIKEEFALRPTGLYGATKAAASVLMEQRAAALGVELLVVRPFCIWGAGDAPYHLVPQVIDACISGTPLKLTPCEVVRDYMHVEEVADRILRLALMTDPVKMPSTVNVGSGRGWVLRDFILAIAKEFGGEHLMQFGALPYRSTEMSALVADTSRLRMLMPNCLTVSLRDGIRRAVLQCRDR